MKLKLSSWQTLFQKAPFDSVNNFCEELIGFCIHDSFKEHPRYCLLRTRDKKLLVKIIHPDLISEAKLIYSSKNKENHIYLKMLNFLSFNMYEEEDCEVEEINNLKIIEYSKNSPYNYFPALKFAKNVKFKNISNCLSKLCHPKILNMLSVKPFIARKNQRISIEISKNIIQDALFLDLEVEFKVILKKFLLKHKLLKENYLQFQISEIYDDGNEKNDNSSLRKYFIIDLESSKTKFEMEEFSINDFADYKFPEYFENDGKLSHFFDSKLRFPNFYPFLSLNYVYSKDIKNYCVRNNFNFIKKSVKSFVLPEKFEKFIIKSLIKAPAIILIKDIKDLKNLFTEDQNTDPEIKLRNSLNSIFHTIQENGKNGFKFALFIIFDISDNDFSNETMKLLSNILPNNFDLECKKAEILKNSNYSDSYDSKHIDISPPLLKAIIKSTREISELPARLKEYTSKTLSVSVPNVKWEDVGGLEEAREEILNTILLPQKYPHFFQGSIKPRKGMLFYGPPGTGKTLLAKAIANECKMSFISIKGPELLNMYVGESEKNVRDIFSKARSHSPCIIFFDELDSLAPKRGKSSDSNQVMDRIVSQLLTEIDELPNDIFVLGATNRPDLLDDSLMRPGRFDKLLYLGVNKDFSANEKIIRAQIHKMPCENLDIEEISRSLPEGMTGADLHSLCIKAVLIAAKRKINEVDDNFKSSSFLSFDDFVENSSFDPVSLSQQDFLDAIPSITPSVKAEDLKKYESLREKFK